jgi:hypothetical protein
LPAKPHYYYYFCREIKEEWVKAKYVERRYFCWRKCIQKIIPLDEHILRALDKVPGHHVGDVIRTTKKKLGRRRPNLTIFKRFSKSEKKNCESLKEKPRDEKAAHSSATTSPELSPEISRSEPPLLKSRYYKCTYITFPSQIK